MALPNGTETNDSSTFTTTAATNQLHEHYINTHETRDALLAVWKKIAVPLSLNVDKAEVNAICRLQWPVRYDSK